MTGRNAYRQRIKLLLLAASSIGAMAYPARVYAQQDDDYNYHVSSGLPEIEIDGSVLENLGRYAPTDQEAAEQNFQPVTLIPPPEVVPQELSAPTLTAVIPNTKTTIAASAPKPYQNIPIQPVIREIPAPVAENKNMPTPTIAKAALPPLPGHKPAVPLRQVAAVDTKENTSPVAILGSESNIPAQVKNESTMKISAQTIHTLVEDITDAPLSEAAIEEAAQEEIADNAPAMMPVEIAADALANLEPASGPAEEKQIRNLPMPGDEITKSKAFEHIEPPKKGILSWFPVQTKVKTSADLDPSENVPEAAKAAAPLPAPTILGATKVLNTEKIPPAAPAAQIVTQEILPTPADENIASVEAPIEEIPVAEENWRQENPHAILANVPIPARRPEKQMASKEFVEKARRTVMETYTVMRNDGAPMPAVAKTSISKEKLSAPRMSVADLANDPLASQILNMSPEDVAATLNKMTPSAGRQLSRELNAISKPRIIRQEGERFYKSRQKAVEKIDVSDPVVEENASYTENKIENKIESELASTSGAVVEKTIGERLDISLPFPIGASDLPEAAKANIDDGIIPILKSREAMRVQITAFASPTDKKESSARRTALSRALAVRSYLITQGIDATRLDVRALGMQTDPQAAKDKVDLLLIVPKKS